MEIKAFTGMLDYYSKFVFIPNFMFYLWFVKKKGGI